MKWVKNRLQFITERERAKIKEVVLPRQAKQISQKWGESFLEMEEVDPTDKIKQGKWKISEEDKYHILDVFLTLKKGELKSVIDWFRELPEHFVETANESVKKSENTSNFSSCERDFKEFDIKNVTLDQLYWFTSSIFTKISVSETKGTEYIVKDENDVPIRDEDNKIVKKSKKAGDLIWGKSQSNFNGFLADYNRCFEKVEIKTTVESTLSKLRDLMSDLKNNSQGYEVKEPIFGGDMYLSIKHNPKDILNMSISKFYRSCQDLYTGMYNNKVLANVFDPNSIPAFVVFDVPIYMNGDTKISDQLPVCRRIIRSIVSFGDQDKKSEENLIFFDRTYPDRLEELMGEIIEKYSENKKSPSGKIGKYLFAPDLEASLDYPYMDRLNLLKGITIGKNVRVINIGRGSGWDKYVFPKNVELDEIVIESVELPEKFFESKLKSKKVTFKFLKLNDLGKFADFSFQEIKIEKCSLSSDAIEMICKSKSKISIISSVFEGQFGGMEIEELSLLYTLSPKDLIKTLEGVKVKKLILSSDLNQSKENKDFIADLKKQGIKIEIEGPKI